MACEETGISVVVRTKNSARVFRTLLEHLDLAPQDELIVVDSGSTDETLEVAAAASAIIVRLPPPFHYSHALNEGFHRARNPWILALSSHCIPITRNLLSGYRRLAAEAPPRLVCIVGSISIDKANRPRKQPELFTLQSVEGALWKLPWSNANGLYRKSAWERHPFSLEVPTAEDMEWVCWAVKEGYTLMKADELLVRYDNRGGIRWMFRKGVQEGGETLKLPGAPLFCGKDFLIETAYHFIWILRGRLTPTAFVTRAAYALGLVKGSRDARRS